MSVFVTTHTDVGAGNVLSCTEGIRSFFEEHSFWPRDVEQVLLNGKVQKIKILSEGSTEPVQVSVAGKYTGVFKEDSGAHFEVAAYLIDRLLGLNLIPPTVMRRVNGKLGSLQFFVEGGQNPYVTGGAPSQEMKMLDYLIGNTDRTGKNYLVLPGGRQVAIDHGLAFRVGFSRLPIWNVQQSLPRPEVFSRLVALEDLTITNELKGLLSQEAIRNLIARKNYFVTEALKLVRANP